MGWTSFLFKQTAIEMLQQYDQKFGHHLSGTKITVEPKGLRP